MPLIAGGIRTDTAPVIRNSVSSANVQQMVREIGEAADTAFWHTSSFATLVRKQIRLMTKLSDPELQADEAYTDACWNSIQRDTELKHHLNVMAQAEFYADGRWQQLTPEQRAGAAEKWNVAPEQPSLVGAVFTAWPDIRFPLGMSVQIQRLVGRNQVGYYTGWIEAGLIEQPRGRR